MRAVIQRVSEAGVRIDNRMTGRIGKGLLVFLGVEETDGEEDIAWLSGKISRLRVFPDDRGIMNLNIMEAGGSFLVVSQFTLHASTKKGNRPSYIRAARPEVAIPVYESFVEYLKKESGVPVMTGEFGAMMKVDLINDGPVTIWIDTKNRE